MKRKTKYRGIGKLPDGRVRIRARAIDPRTGKEREVDRVVVATMDEAIRLQAEYREEIRRSAERHREVPRLVDFATSWLKHKLGELKASTAKQYAEVLDVRVIPNHPDGLGDYYVDKITPQDIREWRDRLAERLSASTVNGTIVMLKMVLGDASADFGFTNPAARISRLRVQGYSEEEPNVLSAPELGHFLEVVRSRCPEHYPLILLLSLTGVRFGEATALKWQDINETAGSIRVERAQWKGIVDTTKTGNTRSVPLVPELAVVLRQHRANLVARQVPGLEQGWVFLGREGGMVTKEELRWYFLRALEAAGIKRRFTVHGLRRTFNNLARMTSGEIITRSITGHVTAAMTEHYSHVGADEKLKAAGSIVSLVPGLRTSGNSSS